MTWALTPKQKYLKITPGVSHIYIVWSQIHQNKGAAVLLAL